MLGTPRVKGVLCQKTDARDEHHWWLRTATSGRALPHQRPKCQYNSITYILDIQLPIRCLGSATCNPLLRGSAHPEAMLAPTKLNRIFRRVTLAAIVFLSSSLAVRAQFKEIPPPPYTPAVARQKIRSLLQNDDPGNRQQTAATLSGLLVWYRDIFDDELIAAWKEDGRTNLPALMPLFADS